MNANFDKNFITLVRKSSEQTNACFLMKVVTMVGELTLEKIIF